MSTVAADGTIPALKKRVDLAYGRNGLTIEVPSRAQVVTPREVAGIEDEAAALDAALAAPTDSPPLAELAAGKRRVVVTHSDITRATPNDRILPVLLRALEAAGVARGDITLINALGTHRPQTDAELRKMLGDGVVDRYRCRQHDAWDDAELVAAGATGRGNAIRLNRTVMEADLVIFTGFIEPHFFAGFSGGPKGALPALAGSESVLTNHGYAMIGDPRATWGITDGNPIWEEMREAAALIEPLFLLNVTLNTDGRITGVFAGDVVAAHRRGCDFVRDSAMVAVDEPFDAVVTTNSGYPLDQNLYQTVKGMQAARGIVRSGGAIIMAAECSDGLPEPRPVRGAAGGGRLAGRDPGDAPPARLLRPGPVAGADPGADPTPRRRLRVQRRPRRREIRAALLTPTRDIEATLADLAPERLCVLPQGPLTIAYLNSPDGLRARSAMATFDMTSHDRGLQAACREAERRLDRNIAKVARSARFLQEVARLLRRRSAKRGLPAPHLGRESPLRSRPAIQQHGYRQHLGDSAFRQWFRELIDALFRKIHRREPNGWMIS